MANAVKFHHIKSSSVLYRERGFCISPQDRRNQSAATLKLGEQVCSLFELLVCLSGSVTPTFPSLGHFSPPFLAFLRLYRSSPHMFWTNCASCLLTQDGAVGYPPTPHPRFKDSITAPVFFFNHGDVGGFEDWWGFLLRACDAHDSHMESPRSSMDTRLLSLLMYDSLLPRPVEIFWER